MSRGRKINSILLVVAGLLALAFGGMAEAKPEQSPREKAPAEKLLEEARSFSLKGDLDTAYRKLGDALQADPVFWQAIYFRAELHFQQQRYESTLRDCAEILQTKPNQAVVALLRAKANSKLGHNEECLHEIDEVISHAGKKDVAPLVMAYETRAWLRATSLDPNIRDGKAAVIDAKQACKLSHESDPQSLDALAAAYAETGDFNKAMETEDRATKAQLVSDDFNMATQNVFQKHMDSYKQHRPVRD